MKAEAVVYETQLERAVREERSQRVQNALASLGEERARWDTASQMLSWFFALRPHMESAPGIDYARDTVQSGNPVDRDERIIWLGRVWGMLDQLVLSQGHTRGRDLLWLHHRSARKVGERRDAEGRKLDVYGDQGIAIRELYLHDGAPDGRNATIEDYWMAYQCIEDAVLNLGWVRQRLVRERRSNTVQAWRRR
jgi:hypothetical protein